jgi:hypothetical protein
MAEIMSTSNQAAYFDTQNGMFIRHVPNGWKASTRRNHLEGHTADLMNNQRLNVDFL